MPPGLGDMLLAATDLPDLRVLQAHIKESAQTFDACSSGCSGGAITTGMGTRLPLQDPLHRPENGIGFR